MVQNFGQQWQAEPEGDEGGRPQRLDGTGEIGKHRSAVQQRPGPHREQRGPKEHAGQILHAVGQAHGRKGHGLHGGHSGAAGQAAGAHPDGLQVLVIGQTVLVEDAFQHKQDKQGHEQPCPRVGEHAVPGKEFQHQTGSQQDAAFAAELPPVHRDRPAQQAQGQHQPQVGDGPRQGHPHRHGGDGQPRRQKGQHQLGQSHAERRHRAGHHPHGQPAQGAAPGGAAARQPAAHGGEHQPHGVYPQCHKQKHAATTFPEKSADGRQKSPRNQKAAPLRALPESELNTQCPRRPWSWQACRRPGRHRTDAPGQRACSGWTAPPAPSWLPRRPDRRTTWS